MISAIANLKPKPPVKPQQRFNPPTIDENNNFRSNFQQEENQKLPSINIDDLLKNAKIIQKQ